MLGEATKVISAHCSQLNGLLDSGHQNALVGSNNMPKIISNKHIDIIKCRDGYFKAVQDSELLDYAEPF